MINFLSERRLLIFGGGGGGWWGWVGGIDGVVRLRFSIGYPWLRKFWSETYPWRRRIPWSWAHFYMILRNFSPNIPLPREIFRKQAGIWMCASGLWCLCNYVFAYLQLRRWYSVELLQIIIIRQATRWHQCDKSEEVCVSWWRHQMETFSALLAIPRTKASARSFDVFFDLRLNKRLSKQSWGWWFETQSCSLSLWRHRDVFPFWNLQ